MFWNRDKVKATWKEAFRLRKDKKLEKLFLIKAVLNDTKRWLRVLDSQEFREKRAYLTAKENNFLGSPEFYWWVSNEFVNLKILAIKHQQDDFKEQLELLRTFRKMRKDMGVK
jgi:hypothetical protein